MWSGGWRSPCTGGIGRFAGPGYAYWWLSGFVCGVCSACCGAGCRRRVRCRWGSGGCGPVLWTRGASGVVGAGVGRDLGRGVGMSFRAGGACGTWDRVVVGLGCWRTGAGCRVCGGSGCTWVRRMWGRRGGHVLRGRRVLGVVLGSCGILRWGMHVYGPVGILDMSRMLPPCWCGFVGGLVCSAHCQLCW